jgi:enamine deaminase RidA (YjgF/YER057c/UK114 family)
MYGRTLTGDTTRLLGMDSIRQTAARLGHRLPESSMPVANFLATRHIGNCLYVSGQVGMLNGSATHPGTLGDDLDVEDGYNAARAAALGILSLVSARTDDSIAAIARIVKLTVFICATSDFRQHSQVANGASDILVQVLGEAGRHTRSAVGVASLPLGAAVEVEAIIELQS